MKKWPVWLKRTIILAGAALAVVLLFSLASGGRKDEGQRYQEFTAQLSDLSVTVHGSGQAQAFDEQSRYALSGGEVRELFFSNGDVINAGDIIMTLENDGIDAEISALQADVMQKANTLSMVKQKASSTSVKAPAAGRVKLIYGEKNGDAAATLEQYGALAFISTDGCMRLEFDTEAELSFGDTVELDIDGKTEQAEIISVSAERAVALIRTDTYDEGANANVLLEEQQIGNGNLVSNNLVPVVAASGRVSEVKTKLNRKVSRGDTLFTLKGEVLSAEFIEASASLDMARQELQKAYDKRDELQVRAETDGVLSGISVVKGDNVPEGQLLYTLSSKEAAKLVLKVDELDIADIKAGQGALVTVDALPGQKFSAEVIKVSSIGSAENNVASYEVTLDISNPDGILSGMSASADINVDFRKDALVVPVEAVQTVEGKKYVLMPPDKEDGQNIQQQVGIGIVTDEYAEILSGLLEGDTVLVAINNSNSMFPMMNNMRRDFEPGGIEGQGGGPVR
ncbi:MAG: efflux RND transporter periplasmic adaptor subunit [Christensenellales bacterium]|jgi:HlyD family secretion protein